MKKYCIFLALCFAIWMGRAECSPDHHHHHDHAYKFSVHQISYRFSTCFEMLSHGKPHGSVVKSSLRWLKPLRDSYEVYDEAGEWCATGISSIISFGLFRPWGASFDIYGREGNIIGYINGQFFTTESAKYDIYNAKGNCVAIAYFDAPNAGFVIVHPEKTTHLIARLTWNAAKDQADHLDAAVYDTEAVHPAIIKIFAAWAKDYQSYFR